MTVCEATAVLGIESGFIRHTRINSRSQRYEVIPTLIAKGALGQVSSGYRGHRAVYEIPPLDPEAIAKEAEGPGVGEPRYSR